MVSAGVHPRLALSAARERSDEGHEAFGQTVSFWTTLSQVVTPPGASAGSPSQGHRPPLGRWLWHEVPMTLRFSFHPLKVPHLMLLPPAGLEVSPRLGTCGCSGRADRASSPRAPALAVLRVSLVGPSFLWKLGCSVESGASASWVRDECVPREGAVGCQGKGHF